jgi:hypothetical protein
MAGFPDREKSQGQSTILAMPAQTPRIPDAQLHLPDGTHLTLFRNVRMTKDKEEKVEVVGDWMIAESPHEPRAVVYFYIDNGQQIIEMVYDKHAWKYGERTDVPLPEKLEYIFAEITDKLEQQKYLRWYEMFPNA